MPIKPDTAHLVVGSSGTYEEHQTWPVAAYLDPLLAKEHADKALAAAQKLNEKLSKAWEELPESEVEKLPERGKNRYDPSDTGADHYAVVEVPLRRTVPR